MFDQGKLESLALKSIDSALARLYDKDTIRKAAWEATPRSCIPITKDITKDI